MMSDHGPQERLEENISKSPEIQLAKVAVRIPGRQSLLTYRLPDTEKFEMGEIVKIPLGKRFDEGMIVDIGGESRILTDNLPLKKIKPLQKSDGRSTLRAKDMELFQWMAKYYHYSLGLMIFDCLPNVKKRPRPLKILSSQGEKINWELTPSQEKIAQAIGQKLEKGFDRFYLHGVTGSGKTLVYFSLIEETLKRGKSVLFLVPEINLTPQFTDFFQRFLPEVPIFPYHSALSESEKFNLWRHFTQDSGPAFVLGVRSSVFLPMQNLGLIIVDEEHDQSFKQSDRCPYNGRDVAIKKAQIHHCPIVLGSATPSMENYFHFRHDPKFQANYFQLPHRVRGEFPRMGLLDARGLDQEQEESGQEIRPKKETFNYKNPDWPLCEKSLISIERAIAKGEQVLVFVNRLGFANFVQCSYCGFKWTDPNTGVNLRYFKRKNVLSSAHSDYQIPVPDMCPDCGNLQLMQMGFGTEKIEEVLKRKFPHWRVARFDREEITTFEKLKNRLEEFQTHQLDILVGTQMLAKGHNFEKVNHVLVLGIDSQLNFPDFRAMERSYQLLAQIAGRAGRYSKESEVLVQTMMPDHPLFLSVEKHSLTDFYETEISVRKMVELPPFVRLAAIFLSGRHREQVIEDAETLGRKLNSNFFDKGVKVLGPSPVMIEKRSGQFTWEILLKSTEVNQLHQALSYIEDYSTQYNVSIKIDVDPYFTN